MGFNVGPAMRTQRGLSVAQVRGVVLVVAGTLLFASCANEGSSDGDVDSLAYTRFVTACMRAAGVEPIGDYRVDVFPTGEVAHTSSQASIRSAPWFSSTKSLSDEEIRRIAHECSDQLESSLGPNPVLGDPIPVPQAGEAFVECLQDNGIAVKSVTASVDAEGELSIETDGRGDPTSAATDVPLESGCYEDVARAFGFWNP